MTDLMGKLSYYTKIKGIGGHIGERPEDFIVEEIPLEGKITYNPQKNERGTDNGEYAVFILKKRMWSTQDALRAIADCIGVTMKRMSAAGNKDRNAVTTQLVSCWGVGLDKIKGIKLKDIEIIDCWKSNAPIEIGNLLGNRFEIRMEGIETISSLKKIMKETGCLVPNYFGPQRFGMRENNHVVGKLIVQGRLKEAAFEFVAGGQDESEEGRNARLFVKEEGICTKALEIFPKRLGHERTIIRHLVSQPEDYTGALKKLPKNLQLMFIQSYQSYLFNKILSDRIKKNELDPKESEISCGLNDYGFIDSSIKGSESVLGRLIGYDITPTKEEEDILWDEGIEAANFRLHKLPELSARGSLRPMLTNVKDLSASKKEGTPAFYTLNCRKDRTQRPY